MLKIRRSTATVKRIVLSETSAANFWVKEGDFTRLKKLRKQAKPKNMKTTPKHIMKTVAHFNLISTPSTTSINRVEDTMVSQPKKGSPEPLHR